MDGQKTDVEVSGWTYRLCLDIKCTYVNNNIIMIVIGSGSDVRAIGV